MCGRFTQYNHRRLLARLFRLSLEDEVPPRYNLAPSQPVLAVRRGEGGNEPVWLRWGLIPSWAKDSSIAAKTINARGETVHEKPAFRKAFQSRRCLIPAEGFYEWQRSGSKKKTPCFIHRTDGEPLVFAGLWERWKGPDGDAVETCAVVTTEANEALRSLHDRMPVIIEEKDFERWLDVGHSDAEALRALLAPLPSAELAFHPVGLRVNTPNCDGPDLIAPAVDAPPPESLFE